MSACYRLGNNGRMQASGFGKAWHYQGQSKFFWWATKPLVVQPPPVYKPDICTVTTHQVCSTSIPQNLLHQAGWGTFLQEHHHNYGSFLYFLHLFTYQDITSKTGIYCLLSRKWCRVTFLNCCISSRISLWDKGQIHSNSASSHSTH